MPTSALETARLGCIEVVGVAGSGKSTVASALRRRIPTLCDAVSLTRRESRQLKNPAALAVRIMDRLSARLGKRTTWGGQKDWYFLEAFYRFSEDMLKRNDCSLLFDQGPLYRLARLVPAEALCSYGTAAGHRWHAELDRWVPLLDMIVMLDAPDPILFQRVRHRRKAHLVKQRSCEKAAAFFADFRCRFQYVVDRITQLAHARVLNFDTSQSSPESVIEAIATIVTHRARQESPSNATYCMEAQHRDDNRRLAKPYRIQAENMDSRS